MIQVLEKGIRERVRKKKIRNILTKRVESIEERKLRHKRVIL